MNRFRRRRLSLFRRYLEQIPKDHVTILDIGGRKLFWRDTPFWENSRYTILLLNPGEGEDVESAECRLDASNIEKRVGDARDLSAWQGESIDIVFSNSVIEHVGGLPNQMKMASEIERLGCPYFIQTPAKYFPVEPHFRLPFMYLMPLWLKVFLVRRFDLGQFRRRDTPQAALSLIEDIRLLTRKELCAMFPGGRVWKERFLGLTKSYVAVSLDPFQGVSPGQLSHGRM